MEMKIVIASDFSGFNLKQAVKKSLIENNHEVEDVGQLDTENKLLYFEAAINLAKAMQSGAYSRGIAICGTGAGVSLIVNKFRGIYCVACESVFTAERTALINNANVLAMGEKVVSYDMGCEMAKAWLAQTWCEGFEEQRKKNNERGFGVLQALENEFYK
jgi:ribose 5-phosphate isomerase B